MTDVRLQTLIEQAWENRAAINPQTTGDVREAVEIALDEAFRLDRWIRLDEIVDRALALLRADVDREVERRFGWASDEDGAHDMARDDAACGLSA